MQVRARIYTLAISRTHIFSSYKNIPLDSKEYDGICESKIQARFVQAFYSYFYKILLMFIRI